jgi:hypothetical protein
MAQKIKGVPISPLTGVLDARSDPNAMVQNSVRMRQNLTTVAQGKLRRGNGWSKLLSSANYNNEDFHDQLLTFTPGIGRQPVIMIYEAESTRKVRSLFVATQSKIAYLNEYSGNYKVIGSGYGGTPSTRATAPRFKVAQVGDILAFTNDFEKPMYHELEQNAIDAPKPMSNFSDFDLIGLTRARVIWSWHNCLFFADLEMDGERFSYRLIWSNFNDPTGFDPEQPDSITGTKDLYTHEKILGGKALGNTFVIYTTHGMWEMTVTGGEDSFAFRRVYNGEENQGVGVLKYINTLVPLQDSHVYMAEDGVYFFSPYYGKPERAEWLHLSTSLIYDNIDDSNCEGSVAYCSNNQLLISVAKKGDVNGCPSQTLRVNMAYKVADLVDHGFTAFCNYRSYKVPTIRDFIIENGICTLSNLQGMGYGFENEGLPKPLPSSSASFVPQRFYSSHTQVVANGDDMGALKTVVEVSRTSNVATAKVVGHGYSSTNRVQLNGISDPSFNTPNSVITVTDADHFTYPNHGPNVSTKSASSPKVRVLGNPIEAVAIVMVDGTVTVKLTAHGLSNGQLIRVAGKLGGNPLLNGNNVAITVLDANTFTYPSAAVVNATQFGTANVLNLIPDRALYQWGTTGIPEYTDSTRLATGLIYYFIAGDNDDLLHLTGPNTDVTTGNHFVYDGAGFALRGQDAPSFTYSFTYSSSTSTPPGGGTLRFNNADPTLASHLYVNRIDVDGNDQSQHFRNVKPNDLIRTTKDGDPTNVHIFKVLSILKQNNYVDFTVSHQSGSGVWTNGDTDIVSAIPASGDGPLVTAKIFTGIKVLISTIGTALVPTGVSRNDPDNPDVVTMTLPAHGLAKNTMLWIDGLSDTSFNAWGARVVIVNNTNDPTLSATDVNHFTYRHAGKEVSAISASSPTASKLTATDLVMEDWNQPTADPDSLCALLGDMRADDICLKCEGPTLFVGASSQDWCLKQIDSEIFYRERCMNPTAVGETTGDGYSSAIGSYSLEGYDSLIRFAPMFVGSPNLISEEFRFDYLAQPQATPTLVGLRVGISAQAVDPNVSGCGIVWNQHSLKPLKCLTQRIEADHLKNNSVPSEFHHWNFYRKGRVLYFELKMGGTGGDAFFTGIKADVEQDETNNY